LHEAAAAATIDEYFASGEVGEVVCRLVELDEPALSNIFVKHVRSFEAEARFASYKRLCQKIAVRPLLELEQPALSSIFVQQ